jgi:hypothetical protein
MGGDDKAAISRLNATGLPAAIKNAIRLIMQGFGRTRRIPKIMDASSRLTLSHLLAIFVKRLEHAIATSEYIGFCAR